MQTYIIYYVQMHPAVYRRVHGRVDTQKVNLYREDDTLDVCSPKYIVMAYIVMTRWMGVEKGI